jgi:alkanesulfonate monooxygenase SsuD/methylene tetrahydromethanopterin reductase-like flavin-dependent oxidoreductase (luciferase family)
MGPQFAAELRAMGVRSAERIPRMTEGIELLRRFWGPEPVSYNGRIYQFDEVVALPKPAQAHIPIMIATNPAWDGDPAVEARALKRVARLADGWQTDGLPVDLFRRRWSQIRAHAEEIGRAGDVTDASLHLMVNINEDADAALSESVAFLEHYYGQGVISQAKLDSWLAFGPPKAVCAKIAEFIEAGCTTPILRFTSLDQRGQVERCAREVVPELLRRYGQST